MTNIANFHQRKLPIMIVRKICVSQNENLEFLTLCKLEFSPKFKSLISRKIFTVGNPESNVVMLLHFALR